MPGAHNQLFSIGARILTLQLLPNDHQFSHCLDLLSFDLGCSALAASWVLPPSPRNPNFDTVQPRDHYCDIYKLEFPSF